MTDQPMILEWVDGEKVIRPALPEELPQITAEQAAAAVTAAILQVEAALTEGVPLGEKLSWSAKEASARAVLAGSPSDADTELLAGEAALTGETVAELGTRILAAAATYRFAVSRLAGIRRGAAMRIERAASPAELRQAVAWAEANCAAVFGGGDGV